MELADGSATVTRAYPLKCRIRAAGGVTRVDVYEDIGPGDWLFGGGLSAGDFAAQLAKVTGPVEVHINSGGGDVGDGLAIGSTIRQYTAWPLTTVVDGFAASIASVIAQAGAERVMSPGSMMMVHEPYGAREGDAADMAAAAAALEKNAVNIAEIYAARAGGSPDDWRQRMRAETWYSAEEAVEAGLADRVTGGPAALPAGVDLAAYALPGQILAALRKLPRAAAGARHEPVTGTHAHPHPAYGAQGGDQMHSHEHSHDGDASHAHAHGWDPDGDGDDDSTPEGDTDHDYWAPDGTQLKPVPGKPMGGSLDERVTAIVRRELHAAGGAADGSPWDGPAAMSAASKARDPAEAFAAICAGEKTTGTPGEEQHWALPHHKHPGDPPNRKGVSSALGYLDRTQDLKDKAAAAAHLHAHQKAIGAAAGGGGHAHAEISGIDLEALRDGLKGAFA